MSALFDAEPVLRATLSSFLGLVWVWAAAGKLIHPREFATAALDFVHPRLWPVAYPAARMLPWLEFLVGLLILMGVARLIAFAASTALLVGFLALLIRSYLSSVPVACNCFGVNNGEPVGPAALSRTAALVVISASTFALSLPKPNGTYQSTQLALTGGLIAILTLCLMVVISRIDFLLRIVERDITGA